MVRDNKLSGDVWCIFECLEEMQTFGVVKVVYWPIKIIQTYIWLCNRWHCLCYLSSLSYRGYVNQCGLTAARSLATKKIELISFSSSGANVKFPFTFDIFISCLSSWHGWVAITTWILLYIYTKGGVRNAIYTTSFGWYNKPP